MKIQILKGAIERAVASGDDERAEVLRGQLAAKLAGTPRVIERPVVAAPDAEPLPLRPDDMSARRVAQCDSLII